MTPRRDLPEREVRRHQRAALGLGCIAVGSGHLDPACSAQLDSEENVELYVAALGLGILRSRNPQLAHALTAMLGREPDDPLPPRLEKNARQGARLLRHIIEREVVPNLDDDTRRNFHRTMRYRTPLSVARGPQKLIPCEVTHG